MRIEYLPHDMQTIRLVASWLHSEWGHLDPDSTLETTIQRTSERAGTRKIPLALIAREDGSPVGTASLVADGMKIRTDLAPWLGAVYVLPNYRGQGLGAALSRRAIEEARGLGVHRVYLWTADKEHFYRALGWKELEKTEYHGELVTVMTYALGPNSK